VTLLISPAIVRLRRILVVLSVVLMGLTMLGRSSVLSTVAVAQSSSSSLNRGGFASVDPATPEGGPFLFPTTPISLRLLMSSGMAIMLPRRTERSV
jgi:hypothetical protein